MKKEGEETDVYGCLGRKSNRSDKPCTKYVWIGSRYKGIVCDVCGFEVERIIKEPNKYD